MDKKDSMLKYGMAAAALLGIGGAIYYLSKDQSISKEHTKERLVEVVDEIFVEHATNYCAKLAKILEFKRENRYNEMEKQKLWKEQLMEMNLFEQKIMKANGLTEAAFAEWLSSKKDDKIIKKFEQLEELKKSIFPTDDKLDPKIWHIKAPSPPTYEKKYNRHGEERK